MSDSIARRTNFHLNAAKNLYSVATSNLDRHQRDGVLMAVLMHLELSFAFYLCEIKGSGGGEIIDVSRLLTGVAAVRSFLAEVPARSAKELISLLEQPDSSVTKVIAWAASVRRCSSSADSRLRNRLFSLEEGASEVISSSSELHIGLYQLPHTEEVGVTIDSLASLIMRQRGDAEEY